MTFNYPIGITGITGLQVSIYPLVGGDVVAADVQPLVENVHRAGWYTAATTVTGLCWYTVSNGSSPGFDSGWISLVSGNCYPSSLSDPFSSPVPGSYPFGSAGYVLANLGAAISIGLSTTTPKVPCGAAIDLIVGNDYYAADNRAVTLIVPTASDPSWVGATILLNLEVDRVVNSVPIPVNAGFTTTGTSRTVAFDVPRTSFANLPNGNGLYSIDVTLANTHRYTAVKNGKLCISL